MTKFFTLAIFFLISSVFFIPSNAVGQANPAVGIGPVNPFGIQTLGSVQDLEVSVVNTGSATIVANKLRFFITVPSYCTILPDGEQTALNGFIIANAVGSPANTIRTCNGPNTLAGGATLTFRIKVRGVAIGSIPNGLTVQITYGGATCIANGPAPAGNNGADDFASSTITVIAGCNLGVSAIAGTIVCNGGTTNIVATATNAPGITQYSITGGAPFQTSNIFNVNASGSPYTITARDSANPLTCIATATVTVTEPTAVEAPSVNIVQPTCTDANAIVTLTNTITGLLFSVDNTAFGAYPVGGFLLTEGAHTLQARNSNNCISPITNFTIAAQPSTPAAPMVGTITQPDCTVSTGNVTLNGLPPGDWVINPGAITGNTAGVTINNLAAGSYNFTVTNAAGCTSPLSNNVLISSVVGAPTAPSIGITQPTCTLATGGLTVTSATTGLTFSLDGGPFAAYPAGGYLGLAAGSHTLIAQNVSGCLSPFTNLIINVQPTAPAPPTISIVQPSCSVSTGTITLTSSTVGQTFNFNNTGFAAYPAAGYVVAAGNYTLLAQNLNGCNPTVVNDIVVNAQPASPAVTATFTAINCFAGNSTITAIATNGMAPYQYSINNGSFQTANTFNVVAGNYLITTRDANGCTGITNIISIIQTTPLVATINSSAINCNGGSSTLTVSASGGAGLFEYSLNNGSFQTSNLFNVTAGTYFARVRLVDNPLCIVNTSPITVAQPNIFRASASALPINNCGGTTIVNVTGMGGTLPYTSVGNFVRGPGKQSFVISDARGCLSSAEVVILPPGCVDLRVFPNPAQNLITVNHSAAISSSAAIQIYASNGAEVMYKTVPENAFISNININVLSSGTYILVFTNGKERKEIRFIKSNKN